MTELSFSIYLGMFRGEGSQRPAPSPYPPLQMDNPTFREQFRRQLITRPVDDTPWRCQDRHQAAYVEEIRRRQPSAFKDE